MSESKMNPFVSIVIPVYNVEKYIGKCLDSILNQTYQNIEIILVDDASCDTSLSIVKKYAEKDKRITIIESSVNRGPMKAREDGYFRAKGNYLMFVDGDDYMPINALKLLVSKAQQTNADIVTGSYIRVNPVGKETFEEVKMPYGGSKENVLRALLEKKFVQTLWGKLYKAELFKNYRYETFDNMKNGEDAYLFYQIVNNVGHVVCIPESVYYYIENPNSSTHVRLPLAQARSIVKLNKLRLEVCKPYPELMFLVEHLVTNVLVGLYTCGFKRKDVTQILKEEGLYQYCSVPYILQTLSLTELCAVCKNIIISKIKK